LVIPKNVSAMATPYGDIADESRICKWAQTGSNCRPTD